MFVTMPKIGHLVHSIAPMLRTGLVLVACAAVLRRLQKLSIASAKRKANQGRTVTSPDETGAHAFVLTSSKKVELYCRRWGSLVDPKAAIILVHSELLDGGLLKPLAQTLSELFVCYTVDLTGFGKSGCQQGVQSHIGAYTDYLDDLDAIVDVAKAETNNAPIVLYGEGLGATCSLAYTLIEANKDKVAAVVATSALLKSKIEPKKVDSGIYGFMGKVMSTACGPRESPEYDIADLFDDEEIGMEARDNFENLQPASVKKTKEIAALCDFVNDNLAQLTVPLLVLHGSPDLRNDIKLSENLKENAGSKMKYFRSYQNAKHGILYSNPESSYNFQKDIGAFISRVAPA